jgi:hypothetical protein
MYAAKNVEPETKNFREIIDIKKVYYDKQKAQAEVERLNDLNQGGPTDAHYFWQRAAVPDDTA